MKHLSNIYKSKNTHVKRSYNILNTKKALINDIDKTLNNKIIKNKNYIKISDILNCIKDINQSLYNEQEQIENAIENKIEEKYGNLSSIVIYRYNSNFIELGFTKNYKIMKYKKVILDIKKSSNNELQELLTNEIDSIKNLYQKYNYFQSLDKENIRATNSSLKISISLFGISIYIPNYNEIYNKPLEIKYSSYENKFYVEGNDIAIECIKGKEIDLLNSIYISKDDCPEYYKNAVIKNNRKKYKIKKIK